MWRPCVAAVLDSSQRFLDRFAAPLLHALRLRASVAEDPSTHLDAATVLVQQAADATDGQVCVTLLQRAVKALTQAAGADPAIAAVAGGLQADPVRGARLPVQPPP